MGLARSTYYDEPEIQPIDEARLVEQIKEVCAEWPAYGYRRVTAELHGEGRIVNHKKVMRLMSLIVASPSSPAALAAKKATSTIPIVFLIGADPVRLGLVESYNRPGGNATGIVFLSDELTAKRVELLNELVPPALPLALLMNPTNPNIRKVMRSIRRQRLVE